MINASCHKILLTPLAVVTSGEGKAHIPGATTFTPEVYGFYAVQF